MSQPKSCLSCKFGGCSLLASYASQIRPSIPNRPTPGTKSPEPFLKAAPNLPRAYLGKDPTAFSCWGKRHDKRCDREIPRFAPSFPTLQRENNKLKDEGPSDNYVLDITWRFLLLGPLKFFGPFYECVTHMGLGMAHHAWLDTFIHS